MNPPDYDTALNVSYVLGLRAICVFNDHRERLIAARSGETVKVPKRAG